MRPPPDPRYRDRFPAEIISHAVWLYHVLSSSGLNAALSCAMKRCQQNFLMRFAWQHLVYDSADSWERTRQAGYRQSSII